MRLIDADALVKELSGKYIVPVDEETRGVAAFMGMQTRQAINNAPTIEAEPIKQGRWIFTPDHREGICSNCQYKIFGRPYQNTYMIVPYNYCPNCGADMRGGENG